MKIFSTALLFTVLSVILLPMLLIGSTAQAQPCQVPGPDTVAIVFELDWQYMPVCREFMGVGPLVEAYLVLINPSEPSGIIGWELGLDIELGTQFLIDISIVGAPIIQPPELPDLQVGLAECLPWDPVIHLATLTFLIVTPDPVMFYIRPIQSPTVPDQIVYAPCDDPSAFAPMQTINDSWAEPVAILNGTDCEFAPVLCADPAIANDLQSWGAVKSLYR
jgi:hypothetical protein